MCIFLAFKYIFKSYIVMYVLPGEYVRVIFLCCVEIFYSNMCLESEILKRKTEDQVILW